MNPSDYKNYKNVAELLHFKDIPYFKAKTLCYRKDHHGHIFLKTSFANTYEMVHIIKSRDENIIPMSRITYGRKGLIDEKRKDIESMFPFMSARDIIYFKRLF